MAPSILLLGLLLLGLVQRIAALPNECAQIASRYPESYVAYETPIGSIVVDGKLDEEAWTQVAWTPQFVDIPGPSHTPQPWYRTQAKIRWDSSFIYFAAFFEETQVWAFMTEHDSMVYQDNAFEVFFDPAGSYHYYKEYQINAILTDWDLEMNRPYLDNGTADSSWETAPEKLSGVYVDGPVNDPSQPNRFWTIELAIPLDKLVIHQEHVPIPPRHNDRWRIAMSRVQWAVRVEDGRYVKEENQTGDYWLWSPHYQVNMHLPERFGYVQFSKESVNSTEVVKDPSWTARYILGEVYYAQRKHFQDHNGRYASSVFELDSLPEYVKEGLCLEVPKIVLMDGGYVTSVPFDTKMAHMRQDRYFWME